MNALADIADVLVEVALAIPLLFVRIGYRIGIVIWPTGKTTHKI